MVLLCLHMTCLRNCFGKVPNSLSILLSICINLQVVKRVASTPSAKYKGSAFVPIYPSFYSSGNFLLFIPFSHPEILPGFLCVVSALQHYDF